MIQYFLPQKIGSYYLISQRIIGLEITKNYIYGSLLFYAGNQITLEKNIRQEIIHEKEDHTFNVSQALKIIKDKLPENTKIILLLPSAKASLKKLTFPFNNTEKISLALPFELEPHVAFDLQNAAIDFIVTEKNNSTTVLTAAIQDKYLDEYTHIAKESGVSLQKCSLDAFNLYGLYHDIGNINNKPHVLITLEPSQTLLMFIENKKLKNVRTITLGISDIIKTLATEKNISLPQVLEYLKKISAESFQPTAEKNQSVILSEYFNQINLTLTAFLSQAKQADTFEKLLLFGNGTEIYGIDHVFKKYLSISTQIFEPHKITRIKNFQLAESTKIEHTNILSLSAAYENQITEHVNFLHKKQRTKSMSNIKANIIVIIILSILTGFFLTLSSFIIRYRLKSRIARTEEATVKALRNLELTEARKLYKALDDAREKINTEEDIWFAFSRQQRFSFLETLQRLSIAIDRKSLGLELKKLSITPNDVFIEGSVKGFEELKLLEQELKNSNLFIKVPTLQNLKFNERLKLKKNGIDQDEMV